MNAFFQRARLLALVLPALAIVSACAVACSTASDDATGGSNSAITGRHVPGDDDGANGYGYGYGYDDGTP